jgi:hypothetical protein
MALDLASSFTVDGTAVTFDVAADGFEEVGEVAVNARHIPGGAAVVVDRAGRGQHRIRTRLGVDNPTDWGQLFAFRGEEGTLAIYSLDSHTAVLAALHRAAPVGATGTTLEAIAEWIITG